MVRKRMIILSLLLCSGMAAGYSQTLSLRKGRSIARQFLNEKMNSTFSGKWQERYFGDGKLMIVNRGDNDGFVIIRSDGDNHTILGYAEHGHINTEAMPENLRYWLQCYAAENEPTTLSYSSNNHEYTAHAPLLATIAWDQNSPYNLMTPYYVGTTHAATGCAATAMAQILYYHHWPLQGKGTVSYSCSTLNNATLETDLSKDIYHWDAMKTQYNIPGQEDSDEARQAVALLMRDCGYAIHMLYGAQIGETGVTPSQYVQAMGFDARTGLFIWQAVDSKGSNLYAVNPATGAASLITSLSKNEQISALFFKTNEAPDKAPAAISDLQFAFSGNGSTTGNITFTVPSKTYDGTALSGSLQQSVYIDGALQGKTVTVTPGQKQTFPFSLSNDNHYVDVCLKNDGGLSPVNYRYQFVGYDTPKATEKVSFEQKDGQATVKWRTVKTGTDAGVNHGFIDANKLTYHVVRMPDSTVVAKDLKDTVFTETLPTKMQRYSYVVYPYNGSDKQGDGTFSDAILYGTAFETPYTDDFTDASTKSLWTIADDNNDKTTWKYDSYNKAWSINTGAYSIKGCDDWLISPAINMKKGYCYAFTANMRNTFRDYKEHVRLLVGTNPEDRKSFKLLAENDAYDTQGNYADWEADFTPEKDGSYYVAVLDSSNTTENCSGVYVKRISVDALGLAGAPTAADSMTVTPDADGALKATITAKAPSKALDGTALTGTLSAALYRDEATTPVAKKDDIAPSATISFVDDKVDSVATHSYSLVFSNGQGAGKKVTAKAFIGIYGDGYKTSARRT